MKQLIRILSLVLCVCMLMTCVSAEGVDDETAEAEIPTALELAQARTRSEEPVHITVGNATKVSGMFFSSQFGNNTSDIDVRYMLHGYNAVYWSTQLDFLTDPTVVEELVTGADANGDKVYTVKLNQDLVWNDGVTPVKAADYVFALLLQTSDEFTAIGASTGVWTHVVGYDEYAAGKTELLAGVHLIDDWTYSITVKNEFLPYFYELDYLFFSPVPISAIAPGCEVADDGDGAYIRNIDSSVKDPIYTAELLRTTVLDPETGYLSHPSLTCGPYDLVSYDRETGYVEFKINEYYKGNWEGVTPYIDYVTLKPVAIDTMIQEELDGTCDVLNKVVDGDVIIQGLTELTDGFGRLNYPRLGYGYIGLSIEKNGPQQFEKVRQALAYMIDDETFVEEFLQGFGITVQGFYGLGQWMTLAAMGSIRPEDLTEEETALWDSFTLDDLNKYLIDYQKALELLIEDGWTLNEQGEPFNAETDTVRCKMVNGELMKLSFLFGKTANNVAAQMMVDQLTTAFAEVGAELIVEEAPFMEILADYQRDNGERKYDLSFLATNFVASFDPYYHFVDDDRVVSKVNLSGLVDDELIELAWQMHITEPNDVTTYEQRWLAFQKRYNEVLPTIPLYSNIYFDFYNDCLKNYSTAAEFDWPVALLYSYWEEPAEEATPTDLLPEDEGTVTFE